MKLYLFGGAGGEAATELKLISDTIQGLHPKQVLWIPFARIQPSVEPDWRGDWPHRYMDWSGIEFLDASNEDDMARVENPVVFISGGSKGYNLMDELQKRPHLVELIHQADYVIGESKGTMALGTHFRDGKDTSVPLRQGLAIIRNTVIEPHYTERSGQKRLATTMRETDAHYGIGIDERTAITFDLADFPAKWEKIGEGNVEVKVKETPSVTST